MLLLRLVFHQANGQIDALPVRAYPFALAGIAERGWFMTARAAAPVEHRAAVAETKVDQAIEVFTQVEQVAESHFGHASIKVWTSLACPSAISPMTRYSC